MENKLKLVYMYENLNLLKYAADMVPSEDLNVKATMKLSVLEQSGHAVEFEDILLLELLNWFKCSFFTWLDAPKCESCGEITANIGSVPPNESEKKWLAQTVENFFCTKCQLNTRFPRYLHPKKLLETRKGRCGEWASCFTLLCRALGYDARFISDWNDHVWTEVFSFAKNRWLHCDPCENVCDKPLLYEIGWKKPVSYVIAFSKDDVQDVTWRYTSDFSKVMARRTLCREEWLLHCILSFIDRLQCNVTSARRKELAKKRALELAEFLTPAKVEDDNYSGRTSGSLAWRIARGEMHLEQNKDVFIFSLTGQEIAQRYFHVKYSCAKDKYVRVSDKDCENEGWSSCTYDCSNIFRKVETDWKMVYLARTEGSDASAISWKFDFNDCGLAIETLKIYLNCKTFESGKVKWTISSDACPAISKVSLDNGKIFYVSFDNPNLHV